MTDDSKQTGKQKGARANRHGDPWQRESDGLWCMRVYPPREGARAVYVYAKTKTEVRAKAKDKLAKLAAGLPGGKSKTVGQYLEYWMTTTLAAQVRSKEIESSTMLDYCDLTKRYILRHQIADRPIADVGVADIRKWQDDTLALKIQRRRRLRKGETRLPPPVPIGARTVEYTHAVLRRALNDALREPEWGLRQNPVELVKAPKRTVAEREPITRDEARALLAAMADDQMWCYWLVVFALGLRKGEGLGLQWPQIDVEARTVKLATQVRRIRGDIDPATGRRKGQLVLKDLKTDASHSLMPLPQVAADALQLWQRDQRKIRMAAKAWLDADLVFTTSTGTAIDPRNINRWWDRLCDQAAVRRVHVHDLRHACATYLIASGVDLKTVSGTLRHTRMATTELYTHLLEDVQRDAADKMDAIIADLRKPAKGARRSS